LGRALGNVVAEPLFRPKNFPTLKSGCLSAADVRYGAHRGAQLKHQSIAHRIACRFCCVTKAPARPSAPPSAMTLMHVSPTKALEQNYAFTNARIPPQRHVRLHSKRTFVSAVGKSDASFGLMHCNDFEEFREAADLPERDNSRAVKWVPPSSP